ncbi:uncharacterized protein (DUF58 family) [Tamaricihabitans halophyticus]|uniref:Uncharacterized protein (DUF58 family) n=1 Tax=Tamaricihabitans halophyticus TaxID=1262583 RepID=A0A4R2QEK6_9PSEU|nr:DUF58 domain-containing protein [Tamaricihabitans halophyticus]TCP45395.1 uncharacterized protein (DUF58 family) [Tamaricihabitans halophyticus]
MRSSLSGLTTRGRCLTAAGLAAALCAVILNERDLLRIAVFVIVLPLLVAVLTARARIRIAARRQLLPSRISIGASGQVQLDVSRRGRVPTGVLTLEDGVAPALGTRPRFVVHRLPHRGGVALRYQVQPSIRGIHSLGPLRLTITDPFGLAEFHRELAAHSQLTVVPRVVPLTRTPAGAGLGTGYAGDLRTRSGQGEDDVIVRPYRHGDDLRKVHWRSTARRDEVMVRLEERPWRGGSTVLLDHRAAAHRGEGPAASLEWAISFAASICLHLRKQGHEVRLVSETGQILTEHSGGAGVAVDEEILDTLAALQANHQRDVVCGRELTDGQELIAILGTVSAEAVRELNQHRPRGVRCLAVLLDTPGWQRPAGAQPSAQTRQSAELLTGSGWTVVTAGPRSAMPQVWAELCQTSAARSGPGQHNPGQHNPGQRLPHQGGVTG